MSDLEDAAKNEDAPQQPKTLRLKPNNEVPTTKDSWEARLFEYAHELSVLKVVTYVGGAKIETTEDGIVSNVTLDKNGKPLLTVIDLIGGDLSNVIDPDLKVDAELLKFHAEQVQKAAAVLPNNIKVLGEFVKAVFKN